MSDIPQCANISIVDDSILEEAERFSVELTTADRALETNSSMASVTILDNDSMCLHSIINFMM